MSSRPTLVYEIRADVLCSKGSLMTISDDFFSNLLTLGFDTIWLLGVWCRSPEALHYSTAALPQGIPRESAAASLFAVMDYHVDIRFGGDEALKIFKVNCNRFGISLIIDFVSNHLARDHFFTRQHPQLLEIGSIDAKGPQYFTPLIISASSSSTTIVMPSLDGPKGGEPSHQSSIPHSSFVFCHGRDAFGNIFGDTVQVSLRSLLTREALLNTLLFIASFDLADGVRCDMANHLSSETIKRTWGSIITQPSPSLAVTSSSSSINSSSTNMSCVPVSASSGTIASNIVSIALSRLESIHSILPLPSIDGEFWPFAIARVKALYPNFIFIGELSSDCIASTESSSLFDFLCDRELSISLTTCTPDVVLQHLRASALFERKEAMTRSVRRRASFCENHETSRIASKFGGTQAAQACALIALSPPSGLRIIHDGQIFGRKLTHSVLIGPREPETVSLSTVSFYHNFLPLLKEFTGSWHIASITPSRDGNSTWRNIVCFFITPIFLSSTTKETSKSLLDCSLSANALASSDCATGPSTNDRSSSGSTVSDSSLSPSTSSPLPLSTTVPPPSHTQQVSSLSASTIISTSTSGGFIANDFKTLPTTTAIKQPQLLANISSAIEVLQSAVKQRLSPTFMIVCNLSSTQSNGHVLFSRADECAYSSISGEEAVRHIQNIARNVAPDGSILFIDRLAKASEEAMTVTKNANAVLQEGIRLNLLPWESRVFEICSSSEF
jgi:hypothetical protein